MAGGHAAPGDQTVDSLVPTYEYTVGGPIMRDRLWFFHAGRYEDEKLGRNLFAPVNTPIRRQTLRRRFEGKGTYSPFTGHTARVSYLNNFTRAANSNFQNEMDLISLTDREDPESSWSVNYTADADAAAVRRSAVPRGTSPRSKGRARNRRT